MYSARDATTGVVIAAHLRAAHTHWTRLKGLLGTRSLEPGNGLWIRPCKQVHMFGMRYAIDVVFLDEANRIVGAVEALAPGKISPKLSGACSALELPAGTVARTGLSVGAAIDISQPGEKEPTIEPAPVGGVRRLWVRGLAWTLGFIVVTSALVAFGRTHLPWERPCPEYVQYWAAGTLLAAGQSPYDLPRLARIEKAYGWDKTKNGFGYYDFQPYHYPPSLLGLILALLVPLGFSTARMTWLVANAELLCVTGYMLRNAVARVPRIVPTLLVPFFCLSLLSVLIGQVTALILFLMAAAWRLLQRRWDRSAGCVLACLSIKPQLSIVLLIATLIWLGRQRRWRAVTSFLAVSVLCLAVSTWWIPSWPLEIIEGLINVPIVPFPWLGTTWILVVRSLGFKGWLVWVFYAMVALLLSRVVLRCALQRNSTIDEVFAVSILATFFVTPTARLYDLPILLIPLFVLLGSRIPKLVGHALLAILFVMPYVQLLWWSPWRNHVPVDVWSFWIPLVLTISWFALRMPDRWTGEVFGSVHRSAQL